MSDFSVSDIWRERLRNRGGAIQAAVAVELEKPVGPYTHADVKFNMVNGQLPNLDLINLAVRMAEKEALTPTVFKQVRIFVEIIKEVICSGNRRCRLYVVVVVGRFMGDCHCWGGGGQPTYFMRCRKVHVILFPIRDLVPYCNFSKISSRFSYKKVFPRK